MAIGSYGYLFEFILGWTLAHQIRSGCKHEITGDLNEKIEDFSLQMYGSQNTLTLLVIMPPQVWKKEICWIHKTLSVKAVFSIYFSRAWFEGPFQSLRRWYASGFDGVGGFLNRERKATTFS